MPYYTHCVVLVVRPDLGSINISILLKGVNMFAVIKDLDLIVECTRPGYLEIGGILKRKKFEQFKAIELKLRLKETLERKEKVFDGMTIEYFSNMEEVLIGLC